MQTCYLGCRARRVAPTNLDEVAFSYIKLLSFQQAILQMNFFARLNPLKLRVKVTASFHPPIILEFGKHHERSE